MFVLRKGGTYVYIIDVVKGLNPEVDRTVSQLKSVGFDVGALAISEKELKGLRDMIDKELDISIEPNRPEKIYAEKLSEFGEVSLPPPSFVAFLKYCQDNDIKLFALDMDEEHYTMAYCDHVTGTQWILQSIREKRLKKKTFPNDDPRDFVKEWDKAINKLKGFQKLEEHREDIIAKNLIRLSKKGDCLAVIEVERVDGVVKNMERKGWGIESEIENDK
ncbi:MAG: hypothetical protein R6W73_06760 [Candidatus Saliniplasma sp.]